jgi:hypothetical protein
LHTGFVAFSENKIHFHSCRTRPQGFSVNLPNKRLGKRCGLDKQAVAFANVEAIIDEELRVLF